MSHYVFCVNIRQFLCRTPEEGSRKVALLAFLAGAIFEFEQFLGLVRFLTRPFLFTRTLLTRNLYSSPDTLPHLSSSPAFFLPAFFSPAFFSPAFFSPLAPHLTKKIRTPNEVRISCVVLYYPTISNLRSSMQRS